jgi:hypothetical protein
MGTTLSHLTGPYGTASATSDIASPAVQHRGLTI